MSRRNIHLTIVSFFWIFNAEKFAKNILAISEVLVIRLQSQLDIEVVILIIRNAEAVTFKHLSVAHASIAQEYLRALGEPIRVRPDHEVELVGELSKRLLPDPPRIVLLHFDLLIYRRQLPFRPQLVVNRLLHLSLQLDRVKHLLLHQQVHVVVRLHPTAIVVVIELAAVLLLFGRGLLDLQLFFVALLP